MLQHSRRYYHVFWWAAFQGPACNTHLYIHVDLSRRPPPWPISWHCGTVTVSRRSQSFRFVGYSCVLSRTEPLIGWSNVTQQ